MWPDAYLRDKTARTSGTVSRSTSSGSATVTRVFSGKTTGSDGRKIPFSKMAVMNVMATPTPKKIGTNHYSLPASLYITRLRSVGSYFFSEMRSLVLLRFF